MLSAAYWFQPDPGPLTGRAWLFYAFYTLVFLTCLAWSGWYLFEEHLKERKTKRGVGNKTCRIQSYQGTPQDSYRLLSKYELGVGLAGLMLVGARLVMVYGWAARIWPLLMVGLAVSGPVIVFWANRPASLLDNSLRLLTFRGVGPPLPRQWQLVFWALHLMGLTIWVRAAGWTQWWAVVLWGALLGIQSLVAVHIALRTANRRLRLYVTPLLPFIFTYIGAGLYLLLDVSQFPSLIPVQPGLATLWALPFYFESMGVAAAIYALLVNLYLANQSISRVANASQAGNVSYAKYLTWRSGTFVLAWVLILTSLGWMAYELFTHRTHGVTGTDPFGYAQVAVDLVTRGTVLHRFGLFPRIADLPIGWAPVIALGYHLPINSFGDAASVWPLGMSVLLAGGYRLLGETGLYVTAPILALLTALLVGWLTIAMRRLGLQGSSVHTFKPDVGTLIAASVALFVWATSIEVIDRSLVPMADVAAALLTTLVWIALLKLRITDSKGFSKSFGTLALWTLIAGITLGFAFDVRYTQLMLITSVGIGMGWLASINRRQRAWLLLIAGTSALIAAWPDIVYRWQVFGSPLANPQARELTHFAWKNIIPTTINITQQLFHGQEFGLLLPFLIAGIIWQWQRDRHGLLTLAIGALTVTALQLPYESLRLRDLLPLFPLLAAWTGIGTVWVWRILINAPKKTAAMSPRLIDLLILLALFLFLLLPTIRVEPLITRTWHPHRASFGYVTAWERAALTRLKILTPDPAVIGTHLNGGALTLHSQRWAFYPGGWTEGEFDCFLARMVTHSVPVFLLDDGPSVQPTIERLIAAGQLRKVARINVPVPEESSSQGQLYEVLRDASASTCEP